MKRSMIGSVSILGVFLLMISLLSCQSTRKSNETNAAASSFQNSGKLASQKFNFDIFNAAFSNEIAKNPDKNILVSPTSIKLALGLLTLGAQGETETLLADALGYPGANGEQIAKDFRTLIARLEPPRARNNDQIEFRIANGIFLTGGLGVKKTFLDRALTFYQAKPQTVKDVTPINAWVKERTRGRIPRILERLDTNSLVVLANAIYFKGTWQQIYQRGQGTFTTNAQKKLSDIAFAELGTNPNKPVDVREEYGLVNEGGREYAILKKKYVRADGAPALSMYFILPPEGVSANYVAAQTIGSGRFWQQADNVVKETRLAVVRFPIVEFGSNVDLKGPFMKIQGENGQSLGRIFEVADLRGLSDRADYVGQAKHRTFMRIDEKGTVAAASTAIEAVTRSAFIMPRFIVDRPYMVALRDDAKGEFIFLGVINDPTAKNQD